MMDVLFCNETNILHKFLDVAHLLVFAVDGASLSPAAAAPQSGHNV